ncbi:hypothetical protein CkaCkLH20_03183 [Colletotrichum karsti]|uniref:Beta-lactamase-related domain-containing protein n=1 Tax=Colletotrichum karsti TaxID=1095194 RepID=A0A9P6II48_9PEZI|nr:uncharacterized protein CkaCkLH20_03183 [Colletotrichum karsti]KAF9879640.1 hypothetical protein CkaCkLH20_03183 [Colletotrichum karsti]
MRSSYLLLTALPLSTASSYTCPPLGPVLPNHPNPRAHPAVRAALATFAASLEAETAAFHASAVSVAVKSALEDEPLLEFHHTPRARDPRGAGRVDENTVYRLASVSKVFAVLAALMRDDVVRWDDPVTKYIPELRGPVEGGVVVGVDVVDWEDVTVEGVAAHVAGIGADMMTDRSQYDGNWESLGLPPIPDDEKTPACGGFLGAPPCTREEFLDVYKNRRPPVYPSYHTPVYSNTGTTLVALVVEAATGKPFDRLLRELILDPVGMSSTYYPSPPEDLSKLFIPENCTIFDWNLGVFNPAGAMYSSTRDMLKFGDAILRHRLLSPARTRRWLKPSTFTSGPDAFVGQPWEGYLSDNLTADGRVVEVYTKGGDIDEYKAGLVLVPEHNVTITILAAGGEAAGRRFSYYAETMNAVLPPLIRALDEAARDDAREKIVGVFEDGESGSRIGLGLDGGPGVRVEDWVMRGFEVVPNWRRYSHAGLNDTGMRPDRERTARVYPTGLLRDGGRAAGWRAVIDVLGEGEREGIDGEMFWRRASCITWLTMDRVSYNNVGLDYFEFGYGEDGRVERVYAKGFGVEMRRVEVEGGEDSFGSQEL